MALKKNTTDLKAGLTFGESKKAGEGSAPVKNEEKAVPAHVDPVKPAVEAPVKQEALKAQQPAKQQPATKDAKEDPAKSLAEIYAGTLKMEDAPRNARIQVVVTQKTAAALDELVKNKKIKSKNDLINFLLEGYLKSVEK